MYICGKYWNRRMRSFGLTVMMLCLVATSVFAGMEPIVMIHGLAGASTNWDYHDEMNDAGFETIRVDVDSFGSNWHRAVEAFAQVKGVRADYGACHSLANFESRYGSDYSGRGFYSEWSASNPVHVFGHSQGGPTARMLERLMREGSDCSSDTHTLFQGGKKWIVSLTTFSGVLDGAAAADLNLQWPIVTTLEVEAKNLAAEKKVMDVKGSKTRNLQFGSDTWEYDLTSEQCREFNGQGPLEYPDTYYFAFATERTDPYVSCGLFGCETYEEGSWDMNALLWLTAGDIGQIDEAQRRKNDGLVSWVDQLCPNEFDSTRSRCKEYSGSWNIGQWYYEDVYFLDHLQVVFRDSLNDIGNYQESAKRLYEEHAVRLVALP